MFRTTHFAALCVALSLPACIAETSNADPTAESDDAVAASSLKPAVKKAFVKQMDTGNLSELPSLKRVDLPTSVQKEYDRLKREWTDFPPYAVELKAGTATVIVLAEDTDGGSYWEFYTMRGTHITGASQSESGDLLWH